MHKIPIDLIRQALEEDGAFADITTLSTVPADRWSNRSYHRSTSWCCCRAYSYS